MAVLESKPFLAPASSAVLAQVDLVEPDCGIEDIAEAWEPGQRIVLRCRAELTPVFWEHTGIPRGEPVKLVGSATCLPARATWRASTVFRERDGVWAAETLVEVDGGVIAVEILADVWVVGPARTGSTDPSNAVHAGAKLWQLPRPLTLELESDRASFPTTAMSFAQTGRRDVPWIVEPNLDADPAWSVSSAIRLYINSDSQLAPAILDGSAPEDTYALIQSDIHLVVFHRLAAWRDAVPPAKMEEIADHDHGSLAALGASLARALGIPLSEALRMSAEEPANLIARSREALRFGWSVDA